MTQPVDLNVLGMFALAATQGPYQFNEFGGSGEVLSLSAVGLTHSYAGPDKEGLLLVVADNEYICYEDKAQMRANGIYFAQLDPATVFKMIAALKTAVRVLRLVGDDREGVAEALQVIDTLVTV